MSLQLGYQQFAMQFRLPLGVDLTLTILTEIWLINTGTSFEYFLKKDSVLWVHELWLPIQITKHMRRKFQDFTDDIMYIVSTVCILIIFFKILFGSLISIFCLFNYSFLLLSTLFSFYLMTCGIGPTLIMDSSGNT